MSGDETITCEELAEALERRGAYGSEAEKRARELYEDIARHREPVPQPGEAWQTPYGTVYLRSRIGDWVDCSGNRLGGLKLERPLVKLVPEGSQAPKPTRAQVRRALTVNGAEMWDETLLDTYTARVMKLLDGAQ